jgi:multiple sugar transport system ATP-binding protein
MTMADRIVLLREGRIEQQGAPLELYERPATRYVAGFLGSPSMNFVEATLAGSGDGLAVRLADGTQLGLPARRSQALASYRDKSVILGVRPEHINGARGELRPGEVRHAALIDLVQPTGARTYATFKLGTTQAVAELQPHDVSSPGERLDLAIDMNRAVLIDPQTDKVI